MTPRKDWYQVQAVHPHKVDPFNIYINRFPTQAKAEEQRDKLEKEGYEHIHILPPEPRPVTQPKALGAPYGNPGR